MWFNGIGSLIERFHTGFDFNDNYYLFNYL